MTGLRGIAAKDYGFLRPGPGDPGFSEWEKAAPGSQGVPGLDPFPQLQLDDSVRLHPGEEARMDWVATSLHWTTSRTRDRSKLGPSGEVVENGKLPTLLTDHRLVVVVPQEYINYQGVPGGGATAVPTMSDRLKLRAIRRIGTKIAPKLVDELLGDMSPRAGHVPLDSIASLASTDGGRFLTVGLEVAGTSPPATANVRLGVRDGSADLLVEAIVEQIHARWAAVGLTGPMLELVRSSCARSTAEGLSYTAPMHRAVGSGNVTVTTGSAPAFVAPEGLTPPAPPVAIIGGWSCSNCGQVSPPDQTRCLRCRRARSS